MDKQLIKKYGKTKLIQILKELQPHLNRKQQELNKGYLRKMRFGAKKVLKTSVNLDTIFAIDTCHDFRDDSKYITLTRGIDSSKYQMMSDAWTGLNRGSLLNYLQSLDNNDHFLNQLPTIHVTGSKKRRTHFQYPFAPFTNMNESKRLGNMVQRGEWVRTSDGKPSNGSSFNPEVTENTVSLFSLHDPNSQNGNMGEILIGKQGRAIDIANQEIGEETHQGIATVIKKMELKLYSVNNTRARFVQAIYSGDNGDDNNLFFKECHIHNSHSFDMIMVGDNLLTGFLEDIGILDNGLKKKIRDFNKITVRRDGGLILHSKNQGPAASDLIALITLFCYSRAGDRNNTLRDYIMVEPNNIFINKIKSIFDIKRLGDHGQNYYALKRANRHHQTNDFWAGIHFCLLKNALNPKFNSHVSYTNSAFIGPKEGRPHGWCFGSQASIVEDGEPLSGYYALEESRGHDAIQAMIAQGELVGNAPYQYIFPHQSFIIYTISRDFLIKQVSPGSFEFQDGFYRDERLLHTGVGREPLENLLGRFVRGLVAGVDGDLGQPWAPTYVFLTIPAARTAYYLPDYIIQGEDEGFPLIQITWGEVLGEVSTRMRPTSEHVFQRMGEGWQTAWLAQMRGGPQVGRFGKKQKRWVADLKGKKKKFVRRQVYSTRKDLVTPSYFEKMTGVDFWKLPVA